jgi:hypothetical protein
MMMPVVAVMPMMAMMAVVAPPVCFLHEARLAAVNTARAHRH